MSEADKMFEELGYRLLPKDINNKGILLHYIRNSNFWDAISKNTI